MAVLSLKIKADTKAAEASIKRFDSLSEELRSTFKTLNNEFKNQSINKLQDRIKKIQTTYSLLGDEVGGVRRIKSSLRAEIAKLIRQGVDPADNKIRELSRAYKSAAVSAAQLGVKSKTVTVSLRSLATSFAGAMAGVAAIRGVASSFSGAYSESRKFTKEIKNVLTLTNELTFSDVKQGINELNPILGTSAELTEGLYQALSAGVEPAKAIGFVAEAAKFAKAGLTDTNAAVDVLTTALNAYGLSASHAGRVSDLFFATVRSGKTTGAELAGSIGKSIPIFAAAGIPLEELNAGLATLTLTGTATTEATTQLNAIVKGFLKPSDAMKRALERQGYASGGALLETEGLAGALGLLQEETGGNIDALSKLLPDTRELQSALGLLSQEGGLYKQTLENMKSATGDTEDAFEKQIDQIDVMESAWQKAKEALGGAVEGLVNDLAPTLSKIAVFLSEVDYAALAESLAVAGAAFLVFKGAVFAANVAVAALNGTLAVNPIFLIAAAVASAVVGLYYLIKNWDKVVVFIAETAEKLKIRFEIIWEKISSAGIIAWEAIKTGAVSLATAIAQFVLLPLQGITSVLKKIPGFTWAEKANESLEEWQKTLKDTREKAVDNLSKITAASIAEAKAIEKAGKKRIKIIKDEQKARKALVDEIKAESTKVPPAPEGGNPTGRKPKGKKPKGKKPVVVKPKTAGIPLGEIQAIDKIVSRLSQHAIPGLGVAMTSATRGMAEIARIVATDMTDAIEKVTEDMTDVTGKVTESFGEISSQGAAAFTKIGNVAAEVFAAVGGVIQGVGIMAQQVAASNAAWDAYYADKKLKKEKENLNAILKAKIENLKKQNLSEEEYNIAKAAAEEEAGQRTKELENENAMIKYKAQVEAFKVDKNLKYVSAVMSGATAVLMGFAQLGPFGGAIFAAVMAGITATQIALISEQKPPPPPILAASGVQNYAVPPGFNGDSFPVMAQSGESVTVTPFGEKSSQKINLTVNIGGRRLASVIQTLYDNGHIRVNV